MRAALLIALATGLAGCAGGPPVPAWQSQAESAAARYQRAVLEGATGAAQAEFNRARNALTATGDETQVAQVELLRCALAVASLAGGACPGFETLRADSTPAQRAYADHLAGRVLSAAEVGLLPAPQREAGAVLARLAAGSPAPGAPAVPQARADAVAAALARMEDPLSRLVAAGVAMQAGQGSARLLQLAVDTAAAQGWRRPLLAWLQAQALLAERTGDAQVAQRARARLRLVAGERP
jgi:hypothetical protein